MNVPFELKTRPEPRSRGFKKKYTYKLFVRQCSSLNDLYPRSCLPFRTTKKCLCVLHMSPRTPRNQAIFFAQLPIAHGLFDGFSTQMIKSTILNIFHCLVSHSDASHLVHYSSVDMVYCSCQTRLSKVMQR